MATKQECELAFTELAAKLGEVDPHTRKRMVLERSVSARIPDLGAVFQGELRDGGLHDVRETPSADAQIRLTLSSDTLLALTQGSLSFTKAWTTGQLKIDASVLDLLKLRSMF